MKNCCCNMYVWRTSFAHQKPFTNTAAPTKISATYYATFGGIFCRWETTHIGTDQPSWKMVGPCMCFRTSAHLYMYNIHMYRYISINLHVRPCHWIYASVLHLILMSRKFNKDPWIFCIVALVFVKSFFHSFYWYHCVLNFVLFLIPLDSFLICCRCWCC